MLGMSMRSPNCMPSDDVDDDDDNDADDDDDGLLSSKHAAKRWRCCRMLPAPDAVYTILFWWFFLSDSFGAYVFVHVWTSASLLSWCCLLAEDETCAMAMTWPCDNDGNNDEDVYTRGHNNKYRTHVMNARYN